MKLIKDKEIIKATNFLVNQPIVEPHRFVGNALINYIIITIDSYVNGECYIGIVPHPVFNTDGT